MSGECGETLAHCFCPLPTLLTYLSDFPSISSQRRPRSALALPFPFHSRSFFSFLTRSSGDRTVTKQLSHIPVFTPFRAEVYGQRMNCFRVGPNGKNVHFPPCGHCAKALRSHSQNPVLFGFLQLPTSITSEDDHWLTPRVRCS